VVKDPIFSKIVINNLNRERWTLSKYACRSNAGKRQFPEREPIRDRENVRPIFFHDTDRIIHSLAYSRYIDKTQVFYLFENDHVTHRVLHVQFVSKIARTIGRFLRLNEDLIEAIALGHDLGHVPYGHDGEEVLKAICDSEKIGTFCHNAQSVRFLSEIENNGEGLNLSLQVLDGILCHNGELLDREYRPNYNKTWEQFEEEYGRCLLIKGEDKRIFPMTLEGCVVRVADVIAYVGRDIEDAIRVNLITREEVPSPIVEVLGGATNDKIINTLVLDLVQNSYDKETLFFSQKIFDALQGLIKFNYERIYFNPRIKTETAKIDNMFHAMFQKYCNDLGNKDESSKIYSYFLKTLGNRYRGKTDAKRIVVDFIAGMTDDFFNDEYQRTFVPQSYGYQLTN